MKETSINGAPKPGYSSPAQLLEAAIKAVDQATAEVADEAGQLLATWTLDIVAAVPGARQDLDQLMQLMRARRAHQEALARALHAAAVETPQAAQALRGEG